LLSRNLPRDKSRPSRNGKVGRKAVAGFCLLDRATLTEQPFDATGRPKVHTLTPPSRFGRVATCRRVGSGILEKEAEKTALMRIEDREDYVDLVAQAVIDRIEERDRLAGLVEMVVHRVVELQQQQAALEAAPAVLPENPVIPDQTSHD
jgi:hypothetical protein